MSSYEARLDRLKAIMSEANTGKGGKITVPFPAVNTKGRSRAEWTNFRRTCEILKRPEQDVMAFFNAELSITTNISEEGSLRLLHGYKSEQIQKILGQYIHTYVMCLQCRSCDTSLTDHVIHCNSCTSERHV